MRPLPTLLLASACVLTGSPVLAPAAAAQPLHRGTQRHVAHHHAVRRYAGPRPVAYGLGFQPAYGGGYPGYGGPMSATADAYRYGGSYNAGQAQVPPRGFYDGYYGPGATVLRRGLAAQYEPGVTQELEPDAKQTATGGPVGGLPGRSGP